MPGQTTFINFQWFEIEREIKNGNSILLHAPKNYGKQYFFDYLFKNNSINQLNYINISEDIIAPIDHGYIWQRIVNHLPAYKKHHVSNKEDFIINILKLIKNHRINLIIKSKSQNIKNCVSLIDLFQEINLKQGGGIINNLCLIVLDDFSLYYYENDLSLNSSIFDFFKKYIFGIVNDHNLMISILRKKKLSKKEAVDLVQEILLLTGGHDGLIIELFKEIERGNLIDDIPNFKIKAKEYLFSSNLFDSLRKVLLRKSQLYEKTLNKYRQKRLTETNNDSIVRELHSAGIILTINSMYSIRCPGIISELIDSLSVKKLIIFLHGLGGNKYTWKYFKRLIDSDNEVLQNYDIAYYLYPTSIIPKPLMFWRKIPGIDSLAKGLKAEIEKKYSNYHEILLVCHSLGGLVAKQYIVNEFLKDRNEGQNLRVKKLLTFATPHNGSSLANLGKKIIIWNYQIKQLCKDSSYINILNENWNKFNIPQKIHVQFIIAGVDQIVDEESSNGGLSNNFFTSINDNHFSIIKPNNLNSLPYKIFKDFLEN